MRRLNGRAWWLGAKLLSGGTAAIPVILLSWRVDSPDVKRLRVRPNAVDLSPQRRSMTVVEFKKTGETT